MSAPVAAPLTARLITLLMVDVEGSTRLWQADPAVAVTVMDRYSRLVDDVVAEHDGWLPPEQGEGDGRFAAFHDPVQAVAAAVAIQRAVLRAPWPTEPLRVRVGVHTGNVVHRNGLLLGEPVHRCSRVCGAGHGGQVLVSAAVAEAVATRLPDAVSLLDLGEHRLRDIVGSHRIFQVRHPDLQARFPALRALHAARPQLPVWLDSFVGREREIVELTKLTSSHRLVTITGPGGSGKTRLAVELVRGLSDGPGDEDGEVRFVDLAALSDPALLEERLAAALGVPLRPDATMAETMVLTLAGRGLLLVADNCEHLPTAGPVLHDLLAAARSRNSRTAA
jgi:class 3 adenylate cyclase